MNAAIHDEREHLLVRFEGCYGPLDAAIRAGDAERVAELIAQRAPLVEQMVSAWAHSPLEEAVRRRLAAAEEQLGRSLERLHGRVAQALEQHRRRVFVAARYSEAG
jgi:hypothetical protein